MIEKILARKSVKKIFRILGNDSEKVRIIGGAVRDAILGRTSADIDFATTYHPYEVMKLMKKANIRTIDIGIEHGTVTAFIGKGKFEITTLRKDISTDGRRAVVQYTQDWFEDSIRRDFTFNALSCDINGKIYDYHNGIKDLKNHNIKFIGDADLRVKEDALRILRFFRFYGIYCKTYDENSFVAIKNNASLLNILSSERIVSEIKRILETNRVCEILRLIDKASLLNYLSLSILNIVHLQKLVEIENKFLDENIIRRLALIANKNFIEKNKLSNNEIKSIKFLWTNNLNNPNKIIYEYGKEKFLDLAFIEFANTSDMNRFTHNYNFAYQFKKKKFPLSGEDLIRLGFKGKEIGEMLNRAKELWFNSDFNLNKKTLFSAIRVNH